MTLWIAWSALVSALFAIAALAVDRVAGHLGVARRPVWVGALVVASIAPIALAVRPPATRVEPELSVTPVVSSPGSHASVTLARAAISEPHARAADVAQAMNRFADLWIVRVWLLASLIYLVLLMRAVWHLRRQRSQWTEADVGRCRVLVAHDAGPAVIGVLRPRIVIPRWVLDADARTRELLLRHEIEHLRAGDSRVLFLAAILRMLFPWNAAIWWMTRRLRLAIEIDCDARVVRAVGGAHAYGVMLLAVGQRFAGAMPNSAFLSEPGTDLETRILAMTTPRLRRPIAASLPFIAIAVGSVAIAAQTPRPKPLVPPRVIRADSVPTPRRVELRAPVVERSTTPTARPQYTLAIRTKSIKLDSATTIRARITVDPKPMVGNPAPRYPDDLRAARTEGQVLLTFNTDVHGIPDTASIRVITSPQAAFTSAIRRVLPAWRFDSGGSVRMAVRFLLAGTPTWDTLPEMAVVEGASVWPVIVTALPPAGRVPEASQGVGIPNTAAGRALKAWLDAQNSGQRAQMEAYNEKFTPVAARPGMIRAQQDWGALDLLSVTKSEPRSIEFVVREKTTGDTDVGIMVMSDSEPALVKWLKILHVPTGKTSTDATLLERLRDFPPGAR